MPKIEGWFQRSLFSLADTFDIGLFRILFCGTVAFVHLGRLKLYQGFIQNNVFPTETFLYYHSNFLGMEGWQWLQWICGISMFMAAAGLATRLSLVIATVSTFLFFLPVDIKFQPYDDNLNVFILCVLALAPGVNRLSIDEWLFKRPVEKLAEVWPRETIILLLGLVYFAAGVSKLYNGGLQWAEGETLQAHLVIRYIYKYDPIIFYVASRHWICRLLSLGTLFAEFSFVFLALFRQTRMLTAVLGIAMHLGIVFFMRINFFYGFCPVYFIFIDRRLIESLIPSRWLSTLSLGTYPSPAPPFA